MKHRTIIVGGGSIGLCIAWELSRRDHDVTLMDRAEVGRATSWAAAGILPPANFDTATDPIDQLRGLSHRMFPDWTDRASAGNWNRFGLSAMRWLVLGKFARRTSVHDRDDRNTGENWISSANESQTTKSLGVNRICKTGLIDRPTRRRGGPKMNVRSAAPIT